MKINKKTIQIIILILIILIIGGYFFNEFYLKKHQNINQDQEINLNSLFEFKNYNEKLSDQEFENYSKRVLDAKEIILNNPQALNPSHWLMIARMKKYVNDFKGAEQIYFFLIQKDENNYLVYGNLADLCSDYLFNYEKAAEYYWKAIEKSETNPNMQFLYYKNLVGIYSSNLENDRNDFENKILKIYENKYKNSFDFLTMLASYYKNINNKNNAIKYLEQALKLDPQNQIIKDEIEWLRK